MKKKAASSQRYPGRPSRGFKRFNLYLDPDVAEWAKTQEGGLSGLCRHLLATEREKRLHPEQC